MAVTPYRKAVRRLEVPFDLAHVRKAPGFEVPDIEGTEEGWRAWTVTREPPLYGVDPKLQSVVYGGYTWYPQQTAEAECSKDHTPADKQCGCGFYSAKNLRHLMKLGYHQYSDDEEIPPTHVKVVGRVANWGQVTEATSGWRSQYSYPVLLCVPYEAWKLAKPLAKAFGCKVRLLNFLKNPGELNQLAVVQGSYEPADVQAREAERQAGRRCHHKQLPLHGHLGGEPYERTDGDKWVRVRWDARPDDPVEMRLSSLRLDRVPS